MGVDGGWLLREMVAKTGLDKSADHLICPLLLLLIVQKSDLFTSDEQNQEEAGVYDAQSKL